MIPMCVRPMRLSLIGNFSITICELWERIGYGGSYYSRPREGYSGSTLSGVTLLW